MRSVTDLAISPAMLARSPNRKAAAAYLAACGATSITVVEYDGAASIVTGKVVGPVAGRWWIAAQDAVRVPRKPAGSLASVPTYRWPRPRCTALRPG